MLTVRVVIYLEALNCRSRLLLIQQLHYHRLIVESDIYEKRKKRFVGVL